MLVALNEVTAHQAKPTQYIFNKCKRILSFYPPPAPQMPIKTPNAPILIKCKTLRHVVASGAEAETGGLFHKAQTILHLRVLLEAIGHKQPPTLLKTDNITASVFVNKSLRQQKSKSWDIKFHWLRDKELQHLIRVFWDKGINNDADYFTKLHPISHYQSIRDKYILKSHLVKMFPILFLLCLVPCVRGYWSLPTMCYIRTELYRK